MGLDRAVAGCWAGDSSWRSGRQTNQLPPVHCVQADKCGDEILGSKLHAKARTRESYHALIRYEGRTQGAACCAARGPTALRQMRIHVARSTCHRRCIKLSGSCISHKLRCYCPHSYCSCISVLCREGDSLAGGDPVLCARPQGGPVRNGGGLERWSSGSSGSGGPGPGRCGSRRQGVGSGRGGSSAACATASGACSTLQLAQHQCRGRRWRHVPGGQPEAASGD